MPASLEGRDEDLSVEDAVAKLEETYSSSKSALKQAFHDFVEHGRPPQVEDRRAGRFSYPKLHACSTVRSNGQSHRPWGGHPGNVLPRQRWSP